MSEVVILADEVVIKEGVLLLVRVTLATRSEEVVGRFLLGLLNWLRQERKFISFTLMGLRVIIGAGSEHVELC